MDEYTRILTTQDAEVTSKEKRKALRDRRLWNPTLAQKARWDGAPGEEELAKSAKESSYLSRHSQCSEACWLPRVQNLRESL